MKTRTYFHIFTSWLDYKSFCMISVVSYLVCKLLLEDGLRPRPFYLFCIHEGGKVSEF